MLTPLYYCIQVYFGGCWSWHVDPDRPGYQPLEMPLKEALEKARELRQKYKPYKVRTVGVFKVT